MLAAMKSWNSLRSTAAAEPSDGGAIAGEGVATDCSAARVPTLGARSRGAVVLVIAGGAGVDSEDFGAAERSTPDPAGPPASCATTPQATKAPQAARALAQRLTRLDIDLVPSLPNANSCGDSTRRREPDFWIFF